MYHFCRAAALVSLMLVFATSAFAQDRIVMKNGDVITGNVSLIDGDDVYIEPSYADEFAVDLSEVATIEIEEAFEVELADETRTDAAILTLNGAGEQVLIIDGVERPVSLAEIAEASEPEAYFDWGATVDWNTTVNNGNTDSRNSLLFTQGNMKIGDHRHFGDLTFRREELNGVSTKKQDLLNYAYNWMFSDPWYLGGSFSYERDPIRELDYRYTAGVLVGRDIFDDATKFLTFSVGVGYSDEEIGGVKESGAVGLWNLRYEHAFWDGVDFFHTQNFTQQFYGLDNTIFKTNTGFRFDIIDDLYANVSLRYDYETEPAAGASKDDSTLQFGIGYKF
jgi:putative salt-induced outer membrane protein YdiY